MPRNHNRRPLVEADPPVQAPPQPGPAVSRWLAEHANFRTSPCMLEYAYCDTCGATIGFAETVATPTDQASTLIRTICWACLVGILMHRHAIDLADGQFPSRHGSGVEFLHLPTLLSLRSQRPIAPEAPSRPHRQQNPKNPNL